MRDRSVQDGRSGKRRRRLTALVITAVVAFVAGLGIGTVGTWTVEHHGGVLHVLASVGRLVGVGSAPTHTTVPSATPRALPPAEVDTGTIPATQSATTTAVPAEDLYATWHAPHGLPASGVLLRVSIPGTVSNFAARTALLYLPPAALVQNPPSLPVAVLLSGQSTTAGPDDFERSGHIKETMDAIASAHRGLAPIVVVPDQLRTGNNNPMCVDGPLGNSRTYLTVDVPDWIKAHLRVQTASSAWAIGGFSQGGTCAIQLGAGMPGLFGNLIDVSGELGPSLGTVALTVAKGFGGSLSAFQAAQPSAVLAAHAPYRHEEAYFAAAQDDPLYGKDMAIVSGQARRAGMDVTAWMVPGAKHGWPMASIAFAAGLRWLMPKVGLGR